MLDDPGQCGHGDIHGIGAVRSVRPVGPVFFRGRRCMPYAQRVQDAVQTGRFGAPLPVDDLFRVLLPVDRRPVGAGLRRTAVEEPGGQQRSGFVGRSGLLQEVAGGALTEPGGEALGEPVAPGELGEGGDDAGCRAGTASGPSARRAARPG